MYEESPSLVKNVPNTIFWGSFHSWGNSKSPLEYDGYSVPPSSLDRNVIQPNRIGWDITILLQKLSEIAINSLTTIRFIWKNCLRSFKSVAYYLLSATHSKSVSAGWWIIGRGRSAVLRTDMATAHAQWMEVETRPLQGDGRPIIRCLLRYNEAWETMQKSGGWKRCPPKWWRESISRQRFPCPNKKTRLASGLFL